MSPNTDNKKTFQPKIGLVVYEAEKNINYYIQVHAIEKVDGKYTWLEGRPFKRESLQELAVFLRNENISTIELKSLLPENVIYYQPSITGNLFIWHVPAGEHYLSFSKELKLRSGKCSLPELLFIVKDKTLFVFALQNNGKRPDSNTTIYHAPFFNVYDDGSVCMGTAGEATKKLSLHEEIARWERRFFGSRFTDAHGDSDDKLAPGFKLSKVFRSLLSGKDFPVQCLHKTKEKTLGKLLKTLLKGGKNHEG